MVVTLAFKYDETSVGKLIDVVGNRRRYILGQTFRSKWSVRIIEGNKTNQLTCPP